MAGTGIAGSLNDIGGAVGDLFGAAGSLSSASAYKEAAKIAAANEALTLRSGQIEEQQQGISIMKAIGGEEATTAGAGLAMSGSGLDLMRSSIQQGALSKQLIANQTEVTAQGFAQQANAYQGQAAAAKAQAGGGFFGGLLKGIGAILSI